MINNKRVMEILNDVNVEEDGEFVRGSCPWCKIPIAILKKEINSMFLPPHASKSLCDARPKEDVGCGQPFQLHGSKISRCGYI